MITVVIKYKACNSLHTQGFSKSETVGLPSDKAWMTEPVYLFSFSQFLDVYGIIMLLDSTDQSDFT